MKNEQKLKLENCDSRPKTIKYFYSIEDFPKFKILEENYQGLLNELLSVINEEKEININNENKNEISEKIDNHFDKNIFIYNESNEEISNRDNIIVNSNEINKF